MNNLIVELSKYILIILICFYTYQSFNVFRTRDVKKQSKIFFNQNYLMFMMHLMAYLVIYIKTNDIKVWFFYAAQVLLLLGILLFYSNVYKRSSRLVTNNLCMLLTISFIILTRINFDASVRQFQIVTVSVVITAVIPILIKKIRTFRNMGWLYGAAGIVALGIVAVFSLRSYGAKLSFTIAGVTIQPSEFVKLLFVFFVAAMFYRSKDMKNVILTTVMAATHVIILVLSKDLGMALIFFVVYMTMLYAGTKDKLLTVLGLTGCTCTNAESAGKAPDYSQKTSWLQFPKITKDVDTFYIYSTAYYESSFKEGAPDYAALDNPEMMLGALGEYVTNASVYEDSTNVFVPYYRQAGMRYANEVSKTGNIDAALSGISYDDMSAALDYYFEKCNNGRPFIIAGHSQGSAMVRYILKNYFKKHPEYYERMVAAYAIGYSITKEDLESNPHMKFATGESDTGVIISWHTEGPKNVEENARNVAVLPHGISINPLNWKRDGTYAPASENLGSYMPNAESEMYEITDVGADAKVVLNRGVIVTNTTYDQYAPAEFFGPQSFHEDDYTLYYNNLKANVAKRIAAYMANQ